MRGETTRDSGRWAARSIGLWTLFGSTAGAITSALWGDRYELVHEWTREETAMSFTSAMVYFGVIVGAVWGFASGIVGAFTAPSTRYDRPSIRSDRWYSTLMAALAVIPLLPWTIEEGDVGLYLIVFLFGAAAWLWAYWLVAPAPSRRTPDVGGQRTPDVETQLPDKNFRDRAQSLESTYLKSNDPMVQSGFHGGRKRWIAERSPLVDGIHKDGDFLDVGCANGLLAEDVVTWAREKDHEIVPHGVDLGARLVDLARERLPEHAGNFVVADAWTWEPYRRWTFVYSLLDLSPEELACDWIERLFVWVEPGGRLIIGSYGSKSRGESPVDVTRVLEDCGLEVSGSSAGGEGPVTRFAWANRE